MKKLKIVLLVIMLIPILLILLSLLLPASYLVERNLTIQARPEAIFEQINTLKHWPEWTAWTVTKYPDMKISFSGPESGVGAIYNWEGKTSGKGTLKITSSNPGEGINYDLDFEQGKYVSKGAIKLEPSGGIVKVSWVNGGEFGWNPVSRIFGLFMDGFMGRDFEEGLRNLQQRVEEK